MLFTHCIRRLRNQLRKIRALCRIRYGPLPYFSSPDMIDRTAALDDNERPNIPRYSVLRRVSVRNLRYMQHLHVYIHTFPTSKVRLNL